MRRLLTSLVVLCMVINICHTQEERILNFDVLIDVHKDRSITVTEDIEVYVAGDVIKRGITRSLPTHRSLNGETVRANYEVLEVEKNGQKEKYLEASRDDNLMLYLGEKNILLRPGVYKYKIKYTAEDQIGIFDNYDEIYWNAIGSDVQFSVERATCRVQLPPGTELKSDVAYLGSHGDRNNSGYTSTRSGDYIDYQTTRALQPGEAFTVAVGFEKGIISGPNLIERLGSILMVALGAIFFFPYLLYTWYKHGQDPPTPSSYPQWNPPDDLSSASVKYILRGSHDSKSFTASVVHLAIAGYLRIEEVEKKGVFSKKKNYELVKIREADDTLALEEIDLMESLFRYSDRVNISGKYDATIEDSYLGHSGSLSAQHRAFIQEGNNAKMVVAPALGFLVFLGLAIFFLASSNYANAASLGAVITFGLVGLFALAFYAYLIKKPTPEKLDLRSRIRGFKMYLSLAEKDRLQLLNPPDMDPKHFESILPYAFALGVEHDWTKKFAGILEQAKYRPSWHNSTSPIYFSQHFGNDFSSSVGAAATKPTDSGSGSTGGGFAGGGGGGGGVGGW